MNLINTLRNIQSDKNRNLTAANLKKGTTCLGIVGTADLLSVTADADAVAGDILKGKTAYVNSIKLTGTYEPENIGTGTAGGFIAPSAISFAGMTESEFDFSALDTRNVTNMANLFCNARNLLNIDVTNFSTSNVTNMASMFYGCDNTQTINMSNLDTRNVTNMASMFAYCNNCTEIDITNLNTSSVTSMGSMFMRTNISSLNLASFDTSNVTNMASMFHSLCFKDINLDLSSFNVSKVNKMGSMFYQATKVKSINFAGWDTSNLVTASSMFTQAGVTNLDIGHFNMHKVDNMSAMFQGVHTTTLNLADWNTSNLVNTANMFSYMNSMISLYCNNWNTSKLTQAYKTFCHQPNLVTLNIANWNLANVTNTAQMFASCNNLSDESLNGILGVLTTVNKLSSSFRTLKNIGFTSDQAALCTTLSNWTNCEIIGWSTGY